MRLMIIEDKANDVKEILDYAKSKSWEAQLFGFQEGISELDEYNPDIVVLDMKDDAVEDEMSGASIFNLIWKNRFRPTIVFSGYADTFDIEDAEIASMAQEPLFKRIPKGDEKPVLDQLDYLADIVPSISRLRVKLNIALIKSAGAITTIKSASANTPDDVLDYLFSTRITQFFYKTVFDYNLPAWVQYISPPLGTQLFTADILHKVEDGEAGNNADQYAIILTPSCDLAKSTADTSVLIANQSDFRRIIDDYGAFTSKGNEKYRRQRDKMGAIMNAGYKDSKLYLPHIKGVLPDLCFDMKKLDIVVYKSIAYEESQRTEETKWIRVASLASPYRERASWAYLHTACRPGVPTIDTVSWVDEIFE